MNLLNTTNTYRSQHINIPLIAFFVSTLPHFYSADMLRGLKKIVSRPSPWPAQAFSRKLASQPAPVVPALAGEEATLLPKMPPFDYLPPPYTGPTGEEIMKKRREFLSPSLFHFYSTPVLFLFLIMFLDRDFNFLYISLCL